MNTAMTYADIVRALAHAQIPVRELNGQGQVSVIPNAGRIIAMAFAPDGPNLFWSHPELGNSELVKRHSDRLVGNLGGDRLWFAPELDYFWNGTPDWRNLSNYRVPPEADPGRYQFVEAEADTICLRAHIELPVRTTGLKVGFVVERIVRMTPPPLPLDDSDLGPLDYVGIQTSHTITFSPTSREGRVDLWHLLQTPVGSLIIVPLKPAAEKCDTAPLLYTGAGGWIQRSDSLIWPVGGTARTKIGVSSRALTGRSGILRMLRPESLCLIVRQFSVDPQASYGDHPYNMPREDQALQIWDGLGFGEMEYHSPVLDAHQGPRTRTELDYLWAFAGPIDSICVVAQRLLGVAAQSLGANRLC
jgi:hypothetical protein